MRAPHPVCKTARTPTGRQARGFGRSETHLLMATDQGEDSEGGVRAAQGWGAHPALRSCLPASPSPTLSAFCSRLREAGVNQK